MPVPSLEPLDPFDPVRIAAQVEAHDYFRLCGKCNAPGDWKVVVDPVEAGSLHGTVVTTHCRRCSFSRSFSLLNLHHLT